MFTNHHLAINCGLRGMGWTLWTILEELVSVGDTHAELQAYMALLVAIQRFIGNEIDEPKRADSEDLKLKIHRICDRLRTVTRFARGYPFIVSLLFKFEVGARDLPEMHDVSGGVNANGRNGTTQSHLITTWVFVRQLTGSCFTRAPEDPSYWRGLRKRERTSTEEQGVSKINEEHVNLRVISKE
ncbi:hypothetical protein BDQ12DRAFT_671918 [Crucibulum laeve]|uniref:Uncharacterized protein n=1 Tax=Crucibulum laeve TaxID=68775 RepID=A0A5C3LGS6_9AGAR|nr:hypothetical protein BDQ12DRAFT_671918 [Crucibulum laeve]